MALSDGTLPVASLLDESESASICRRAATCRASMTAGQEMRPEDRKSRRKSKIRFRMMTEPQGTARCDLAQLNAVPYLAGTESRWVCH